MKSIENIGIAGFGPMGQLMAKHLLPENAQSTISDPDHLNSRGEPVLPIDLGFEDAVLLTVPASQIPAILKDVVVSPKIKNQWDEIDGELREDWIDPLIIDACSVKMWPERVLDKIDPNFPEVLHCHPLFGPQSIQEGVAGQTVVVTKKRGEKAEQILDLWQQRGLKIVEMSALEHDKRMAKIQAVTFILGRLANIEGLAELVDDELATPSLLKAIAIAELDQVHSDALFETIVAFNPFVVAEIARLNQNMWRIKNSCVAGNVALASIGLLS